jgi:tetraacyldisaccharide 4'-kinase
VGGTGKTTLVLHLARQARRRGLRAAVVCRRYRPGPGGRGDEEMLYREALGPDAVFAGRSKRDLAASAASAGMELILVDDGFSHWALARDVDIVLVDATDPWAGGALLPRGGMREPYRALQRADALVVSRHDGKGGGALAAIARYAPGALLASARHRPSGTRALDGTPATCPRRVRVVTATGNPEAVKRTALEIGHEVVALASYRDHHWFSVAEARAELERAAAAGAAVLVSRKDAVRWPDGVPAAGVHVLDVEWDWLSGGEAVERLVWGDGSDA